MVTEGSRHEVVTRPCTSNDQAIGLAARATGLNGDFVRDEDEQATSVREVLDVPWEPTAAFDALAEWAVC